MCMCMCMNVCIYVYGKYICAYVYVYLCIAYVHVYVYVHMCICVYISMFMCICTYVCVMKVKWGRQGEHLGRKEEKFMIYMFRNVTTKPLICMLTKILLRKMLVLTDSSDISTNPTWKVNPCLESRD